MHDMVCIWCIVGAIPFTENKRAFNIEFMDASMALWDAWKRSNYSKWLFVRISFAFIFFSPRPYCRCGWTYTRNEKVIHWTNNDNTILI